MFSFGCSASHKSQINDVQRHFYDTKQTRVVLPRRGRCWYVILRQRMFWHNYLFITDCKQLFEQYLLPEWFNLLCTCSVQSFCDENNSVQDFSGDVMKNVDNLFAMEQPAVTFSKTYTCTFILCPIFLVEPAIFTHASRVLNFWLRSIFAVVLHRKAIS